MAAAADEAKIAAPLAKEADRYAWAVRQAELLRAGRLDEIDPAAIAEEIDELGSEEYHRLEAALRVLMLHLLKWDHQPGARSRSWSLTIREQRRRVERQLSKNPALKARLEEALDDAYEDARIEAASETGLALKLFPTRRSYAFAEAMERAIVWPGDEGQA